MLLRRYKRNDKLDLTQEEKQLNEQELDQKEPGTVRDETEVTVTPPEEQGTDYEAMTVAELKEEAKSRDLEGYSNMRKEELIALLKGE